jgi:nucleoid DNA-binding protein
MTKQKEILNKLAKQHGLSITQATEVWDLFIDKVANTISDPDKKTDGEYDVEKFKTIHIDNFGKFIPNVRNIRHANMCLKKKDDRHKE